MNILDKIIYKKQTIAAKNHTCEMCGSEIHKNELIWWYKPKPVYVKATKNHIAFKFYYKWRKRCYDCEPKSYAELEQLFALEYERGGY